MFKKRLPAHNDLNSIINCFIGYFETYLICRFSKKKNSFLINKKINMINFFSINRIEIRI